MSGLLCRVIENASFAGMLVICLLGAYAAYKRREELPGADLIALGLILHATYSLLAISVPGFTGSYFEAYAKVGAFESASVGYYISYPLRLGQIIAVAGLFRVGRHLKA